MPIQGVVMSASPNMSCLMDYKPPLIHSYLSFYGMFLFLAAVVSLLFALGFGSWDLLLGCVKEGLEAWKQCFNFISCL